MTYAEALAALKAQQPGHLLLRLLSLAETPANRLILERELSKFPDQEEAPKEIASPGEQTGVLDGLFRQQSDLFGERRKLSNSFHDCQTDADRRAVSISIQSVQARIEFVRSQIKDFKALGHLPKADEKYPVPEDPFKLGALRASLRASISRKTRELKDLALEALDGKEDLKKTAASETKLRELQNHLKLVQKSIQDRNIQSSGLREG